MSIIDIHVHPPDPDIPHELTLATVRKMLEAGRRAGIARQVFMGWIDQRSNDFVRALMDIYPDEIIGFLRGMGSDPSSPETLEKYITQYGFKGIKLHDESVLPLGSILGCHPIFKVAEMHKVPVLIHTFHEEEGLSADRHNQLAGGTAHFPVRLMAELGKRYPNVTFIFAHAGMVWEKAFQAAQPYPNLNFDISGFDPERGIVEKAVKVLGAERVLFGSDAPGRSYAAQIAKVQYADISAQDRALILGGNAARLLNLR